jgi:mono/diheme cytochrome c family protein
MIARDWYKIPASELPPSRHSRRNWMKIKTLMVASVAAVCTGYGSTALADAKATFNDVCAECHEAADFEGEDAKELEATIKKISAGQMKHKKAIKLTDADAAAMAAFMAGGGK